MDSDCLENTIKDFGTNMPNVITAADDFDFASWLEDKPKKPLEPIVYKHDPVALAMASYRIWQTTPNPDKP